MVTRLRVRDEFFGLALILPASLIVGALIFLPVAQSVAMGFVDYTLRRNQDGGAWNNFTNFAYLIETGELWNSWRITLLFVIGVVTALIVAAVAMAIALNQRIFGQRLLRSVVLLPWVTPTMIAALLWMWILQPQYGVANFLLRRVGMIEQPISWLASIQWALPSVMVASFWRQFPFVFIVVLAGLQSIPVELYESAMIDGAGFSRRVFSITIPLLRNVIRVVILMSVIQSFRQFPLVWTMTGGGPIDATETLAVLSYKQSFVNLNFGRGSAVATVWLVTVLTFSVLFTRLVRTREY